MFSEVQHQNQSSKNEHSKDRSLIFRYHLVQRNSHIRTVRISAFKNMPVPKTPKKVKSFFCAKSYYQRFIPKFAELAKPLMDLSLLHPSQFKWNDTHQKAFQSMIDAIQVHTF
jgi:hypothetical protein